MPTSPPLLQFLRLPGYQSMPVPGSTWLYFIEPNRPISYTAPISKLSPTVPGGGVLLRASRRDTSVPIDQAVAVDMGVYNRLIDAQQACQDNADLNQLGWALVWITATSYQSREVAGYSWIYNITQPSADASGVLYWRSIKRDASLTDQFQNSIPLGNFDNLADAMTSCLNDFAVTYPAVLTTSPTS